MKPYWIAVFLFTSVQILIGPKLCSNEITLSTRPVPSNTGPYAYGDYLYLQATTEPIIQAAKVTKLDLDNFIIGKMDTKTIDFSWDPGFRIGIGYNIGYNEWNIDLSWMRLRSRSITTLTSSNPDLLFIPDNLFFPPEGDYLAAPFSKGEWNLHFDSIDLDLGREFYFGNHFIVRPHFGLKTIWDKQDLHITTTDLFIKFESVNQLTHAADIAQFMIKGKFWGIGPTIGISGKWNWIYNFGLFGKLKGGLLWGSFSDQEAVFQANFDLSKVFPIPPFSFTAPNTVDKQNRVKPVVEMQLGLDWEQYFCENRVFMRLFLGFEMQHYWKQNILVNENYLNLKGLVVSAKLGF